MSKIITNIDLNIDSSLKFPLHDLLAALHLTEHSRYSIAVFKSKRAVASTRFFPFSRKLLSPPNFFEAVKLLESVIHKGEQTFFNEVFLKNKGFHRFILKSITNKENTEDKMSLFYIDLGGSIEMFVTAYSEPESDKADLCAVNNVLKTYLTEVDNERYMRALIEELVKINLLLKENCGSFSRIYQVNGLFMEKLYGDGLDTPIVMSSSSTAIPKTRMTISNPQIRGNIPKLHIGLYLCGVIYLGTWTFSVKDIAKIDVGFISSCIKNSGNAVVRKTIPLSPLFSVVNTWNTEINGFPYIASSHILSIFGNKTPVVVPVWDYNDAKSVVLARRRLDDTLLYDDSMDKGYVVCRNLKKPGEAIPLYNSLKQKNLMVALPEILMTQQQKD